jgi:hypothetical protein
VPSHVYRRLHLNLPGLPLGAAFSAETVMDAVARGVRGRKPESGIVYHAFVDMSGGSHDDATLGIAYKDNDGRAVLAHVMNQGPPPPFDPRAAVTRFATVCKEYGITRVVGDRYAGETFQLDFLKLGIAYEVAGLPASKIYEALEPSLNAREIILLDHPVLESQLLSLTWRGGKIDHPVGETDDFANAAAGALLLALDPIPEIDYSITEEERWQWRRMQMRPGEFYGFPEDEIGGNIFDKF